MKSRQNFQRTNKRISEYGVFNKLKSSSKSSNSDSVEKISPRNYSETKLLYKDEIKQKSEIVEQTEFIEEIFQTRSQVLSQLITIVICLLFYNLYHLTSEYITLMFFSIISSIALKPIKNYFVDQINIIILISNPLETRCFKGSLIYIFLRSLFDFKRTLYDIGKFIYKFQIVQLTSDIYYVTFFFISYILLFKVDSQLLIILLNVCIILDFVLRLIKDFYYLILKCNVQLYKFHQFFKQLIKIILSKETVNQLVTCFMIFFFCVVSFTLASISILMVLYELKFIYQKIQDLNIFVYLGIDPQIFQSEQILQLKNQIHQNLNPYLIHFDQINHYNQQQSNKTTLNDPFKLQKKTDFIELNSQIVELYKKCFEDYIKYNFPFKEQVIGTYCQFNAYNEQFNIHAKIPEMIKSLQGGINTMFSLLFNLFFHEIYSYTISSFNSFCNIIVYFFCLYYLLISNNNLISNFTSIMPATKQTKSDFQISIQKSIYGVFACSFKISLYHFMFTWLFLDILQIPIPFIVALMAGFCSLIPLFQPITLIIPISGYVFYQENNLLKSIFVLLFYINVSSKVFTDIYKKNIDIHPYVTGLSIFMGYYTYNLQGIIYGPLLVCIIFTIKDLFKNNNFKEFNYFQNFKTRKLSI